MKKGRERFFKMRRILGLLGLALLTASFFSGCAYYYPYGPYGDYYHYPYDYDDYYYGQYYYPYGLSFYNYYYPYDYYYPYRHHNFREDREDFGNHDPSVRHGD